MIQVKGLVLLCFCCALINSELSPNAEEMIGSPLQHMEIYIDKFQQSRRKFHIHKNRNITGNLHIRTKKQRLQLKEGLDQQVYSSTTESTDNSLTFTNPATAVEKLPVSETIQEHKPYILKTRQSTLSREKLKPQNTHSQLFPVRSRPKMQLLRSRSAEKPDVDNKSNSGSTVLSETSKGSLLSEPTTPGFLRKSLRRKPNPIISTEAPKVPGIQTRRNLLLRSQPLKTETTQESDIEPTTYHPPLGSHLFNNRVELTHVNESKQDQPKETDANNQQRSLKNIDKVLNKTFEYQRGLAEEVFQRQAQNAKYQFSSNIDDGINGNLHQRIEVRDGLSVNGRYSYSDGYHKRTVFYEADDKGYRVVKEEIEPIQNPLGIPDGHAKVSSYIAGKTVKYEINKNDGRDKIKIRFKQVEED
ncbi:hypothetical protein HUJ04_000668 [Dendroctonus ponderosae]|nr:hypothetical protein HUJ04_000668 [Dendroctonus ponderosae]